MSDWEADDEEYPSAPVPPHERAWRHPSELSPMVMPTSTRPMGRATLVGAGVIGLALIAGLVQLLLPRSGGSGVATQATSALRAPTTGQSVTSPTVQLRNTTVEPVATAAPETAAPTVSAVVTFGMSAVPTLMVMSGERQSAVPIGDGRKALTTAGHLSKDDAIEVQLDDGSSARAVVVKVDVSANVAVLQLTEPCGSASPVLASSEPQRGDEVLVGANDAADATDGVLESTQNGMVVKTDATPAEGTPITDRAGALIGLASTDSDGTVHLVSIAKAIVIAYDNEAPLQVWLGVAFSGDELTIDSVQPASPAELAGVVPGDVLRAVGGSEIDDVDQLWQLLSVFAPGDLTTLRIQRGDEIMELQITLGARPS